MMHEKYNYQLLMQIVEQLNEVCTKNDIAVLKNKIDSAWSAITLLGSKIENAVEAEVVNKSVTNDISSKGLFVVGHARSGTSILIDAVNSSDDIYCLTEAFLYLNFSTQDFSSTYNKIQKNNGNPRYKSTYCPDVGDVWSVLSHLSNSYKYIGEKLAFRLNSIGYDMDAFFEFSVKYFNKSNYICVIRNPIDVVASNLSMFSGGVVNTTTISDVVTSQLQTYQLIISLAATLPNVYLLNHESITQQTFDTLSEYLGFKFDKAGSFYVKADTELYPQIKIQLADNSELSLVQLAYEQLQAIFCKNSLKLSNWRLARRYLYHIQDEINRRSGKSNRNRFGIYQLSDELNKLGNPLDYPDRYTGV